jgi:hypothetical protein
VKSRRFPNPAAYTLAVISLIFHIKQLKRKTLEVIIFATTMPCSLSAKSIFKVVWQVSGIFSYMDVYAKDMDLKNIYSIR